MRTYIIALIGATFSAAASAQVRPPPRPPRPPLVEREAAPRRGTAQTHERLVEDAVRGGTTPPRPPSLAPRPGFVPAPRPPVGEIPSIGPLEEPIIRPRDGESIRHQSQRLAKRGLDAVCPSGAGCPRRDGRAPVFMRGAWESPPVVEAKPGTPPPLYDATSARCGAPGCNATAEGVVGTDKSQRVEARRPTGARVVREFKVQSDPATAAAAREAAIRLRLPRLPEK